MKYIVFGGGGQVARHFARLAHAQGHEVYSVVRNKDHFTALEAIGAKPVVLSIEDASISDVTALLADTQPDGVLFAAGAGGKGSPDRTQAVDYHGAVKVYDAMEASHIKRLVLIGSIGVRGQGKPHPHWLNEQSKSDSLYKSIGSYMQAKYDSELELRQRTFIDFTVLRPGLLTNEPARGADIGQTQLSTASRELVAQVALLAFGLADTKGMVLDIVDGTQDVAETVKESVSRGLDSWTA